MKTKTVLFDFGGTLDSDGISWKDRFYPIYRDNGLDWSFKEFERFFYASDDYLTAKTLKNESYSQTVRSQVALTLKNGRVKTRKNLSEKVASRFLNDSVKMIHKNIFILRRLKKKYRMGIVSNFYGNLERICGETRLNTLFDVIVDSAVAGFIKPDPRIFYCALDRMQIRPEEAVFIGDNIFRDMKGAKSIGMPHIWLKSTPPPKGIKPCCKGDRVIRTLPELEKILL